MVSQVVNLRLAGDVPEKERRTTGNVGECRSPHENEENLCNPTFGRRTTGKDGEFRENPRKESRSPKKKGEP